MTENETSIFMQIMNLPFAREAMSKTSLARPARPDDDPASVLVIGQDFHYLVTGKGDELMKTDQEGGPLNAPGRVVIDTDAPTEDPVGTTAIAIRATDGRAFRVDPDA